MAHTVSGLAGLAVAFFAAGQSLASPQVFDKTLEAAPGAHLTVDTDGGSVSIQGSDARTVTVHVDMDESDHLRVAAEQTATGVQITGRRRGLGSEGLLAWLSHGTSHVRFIIRAPRNMPVEVRTSGGGITLSQLGASITAHTDGGALNLREVGGPIDAGTSGGSIDAQHILGPAKLETSGGPISVGDSRGDLEARTSGGSITVETTDGQVTPETSGGSVRAQVRGSRGVHLDSSGGSITLLIAANARATIDAHTDGGSVSTSLPVAVTGSHESSTLRGTLNGGGEAITLHTSGGGIRIDTLP